MAKTPELKFLEDNLKYITSFCYHKQMFIGLCQLSIISIIVLKLSKFTII